jgi:orotidine-5'-phosphate decarboxylase
MIPRPENPIVVALDVSDIDRAETLARSLEGRVGMFKIGLELFSAHGPAAVLRLRDYGPIFLDLKLHDIPNTVERAVRNCARMGVAMISVHALGGEAMMRAAVRGAAQGSAGTDSRAPIVAGVTVLSSLSGEELASSASLAFEAKASGAGAVVVSGEDVRVVREVVGDAFMVVVPGIRPAGSNGHDQVRILTPEEALEAGADYLVIGRAITDSPDLAATAESILAAIR